MATAGVYDPKLVEPKWQRVWDEKGVYRARAAPSRPKFFACVPFPYMNGRQHLGFGVSFLRAEFLARYKRMTGFNVLLPQAFHCTGLPILGAARRVAEHEPKQIEILRAMGIPEDEIPKFADPLHWVAVFPEAAREDLRRLGAAVDWSRSFITTHLNPPYDAFVRWQFRRLREGGYVQIGSHPVIWCPKDRAPIGDHDRLEGEGVQPVQYTLLKFPWRESFLVAATLRPETIFGQTNLWVDPDVVYVKARVDGETWVVNRQAVDKLEGQGRKVAVVGEVPGRELVGQQVLARGVNRQIPVLPSKFLDQRRGTGIVTSVPSDAPDDWMALRDLQSDEAQWRALRLDPGTVRSIRPIAIIRSEGWGPLPAVEISERMGIRNQLDREKLEAAKAEIYRTGFYTGVMTEAAGEFAGQSVEEAKTKIRDRLVEAGQAAFLWEPADEVVCRCTTRAIVKIVEDQWFLTYGDAEWKKAAHAALNKMILYPESVRKQFHHTVDWLRDWACAHHQGLGTKLPWDDHWVIESLSDSTAYMAYYTIAHAVQDGRLRSEVPWAQKLTDAFFDYVFLDEGTPEAAAASTGLDARSIEVLRKEFQYWYPVDLRNTGKDLVQNHMTFCLFNHAALFPPEKWPRGFGINGMVHLGGTRMSKSKGIVWYLNAAIEEWGADVIRLLVANAGDGADDPRLDLGFAEVARTRIATWFAEARTKPPMKDERTLLDAWFLSQLTRSILAAREAMEAMEYRTALRSGFFDLQAAWNWYVTRVETPNRAIWERFVEAQTKLLAPFAPHVCEEVWQRLGHSDFVVSSSYPEARQVEIDVAAEAAEATVRSTLLDIREILKVTGLTPRRVTLFIAPRWKRTAYAIAVELAKGGTISVGAFMARAMEDASLRERSKDLAAFAKGVVDDLLRRKGDDLAERSASVEERSYLASAAAFLSRELSCVVEVRDAEETGVSDPHGKARHAMPGRPAISVE